MKILVTGATGLVGSKLVELLLLRGDDVRILRRQSSTLDLLGENADRVDQVVGDVTSVAALKQAVDGVEVVFHAAAMIANRGRKDVERLFNVNVGGTRNVVNACVEAGVKRIVHTSSIAALGRPEGQTVPITEAIEWTESPFNTRYSVSKHEAELEIRRGIAEGVEGVMLNPSLVLGICRPGENTRIIVDRIRTGKLPAVPAGGVNVVDVDDVAAGHIKALDRGRSGERYILGSENISWRDLADAIANEFGVEPIRRNVSKRAAMTYATVSELIGLIPGVTTLITRERARMTAEVFRYSNRKAIEELGCSFRPFSETLSNLAAAIRNEEGSTAQNSTG